MAIAGRNGTFLSDGAECTVWAWRDAARDDTPQPVCRRGALPLHLGRRLLALFCCGGHPGMPTTMSPRTAGAPALRLRFCCVLRRKAGPPPRCSPAPKGRAAVRRSSIGWPGKTQKGRSRACPLPSDADGLLRGPPPASSGRVGLGRQLDPHSTRPTALERAKVKRVLE